MPTLLALLLLGFLSVHCNGVDVLPGASPVTKHPLDLMHLDTLASRFMESGDPAVVHGMKSALGWPAFDEWSEELFKREQPLMRAAVSSEPTSRLHSAAHPLAQMPGVEWRRPFQEVDVPAVDFFARNSTGSSSGSYLSFFSPLGNLPEAVQRGVGDTWPLSSGHRPVLEVNVWIGRHFRSSATPFHYDGVHNAYVQVKGRKRVVLLPPEAWPLLHLFPKLHPSSRMSQAPLQDPLLVSPLFPHLAGLEGLAQAVTLEPGDLLYIPPYWFEARCFSGSCWFISTFDCTFSLLIFFIHCRFHHVTALEGNDDSPSLSVSVHTDSVDMDIREGLTAGGWQAPVWGGLTQAQRIHLVAAYLTAVLGDLSNLEIGGDNKNESSCKANKQESMIGSTSPGSFKEPESLWTVQTFVGALIDSRYALFSLCKQLVSSRPFTELPATPNERYSPLKADNASAAGLAEKLEQWSVDFWRTAHAPPPMHPRIGSMVESRARSFAAWRRSRIRVRPGAW